MFISIAGNIGSGKTNLAKTLSARLGYDLFLENFEDNPYLQKFYQDQKTWAFHSQVYFLSKGLKSHTQIMRNKKSAIQDRSLYENAEVFAQQLFRDGIISQDDWKIYFELYTSAIDFLPPPDIIIYLQADTDFLIERIKRRNRLMENGITEEYTDYVERINQGYEKWLKDFTACPILTYPIKGTDLRGRPEEITELLKKAEQLIGRKIC